ncbi:MAG: hypothetical protein M0Q13_04710 [Methanothrix sp.]|jgi:hypothetical protein|nr:hypothetical protein [Methanothrix sp.]
MKRWRTRAARYEASKAQLHEAETKLYFAIKIREGMAKERETALFLSSWGLRISRNDV